MTAKSYHADLENLQASLSLPEGVMEKKVHEKDCLPVEHLAFLPMKRTKSFLLQSIFIHFGLKNHLRLVLRLTPYALILFTFGTIKVLETLKNLKFIFLGAEFYK